jgi:GT2 family glycosyltransferase
VRVSFIIPVRNDALNLQRCLDSIARLETTGAEVEVLVIDNGSADDSVGVARRAGARVLVLPGERVSALRNQGVHEAAGEVLAFVDADHELSAGWLAAALETLSARPEAAGVGAACWPPPSPTWVQRMYDALRGHVPVLREVEWLGAGNMVVRRSAFEGVGGFDTSLVACEDADLCNRLRAAGGLLLSDPRLRNVHFGDPATLRRLFRSELWRGRDNLRVTLRGPLSARSLASAMIPAINLTALAAIAAGLVGLAFFPAGAGWVIAAGAAVLGALTLLRAGRILGRLDRVGPLEALQAGAVALVYDLARALALIARAGHRNRRVSVPAGTPAA